MGITDPELLAVRDPVEEPPCRRRPHAELREVRRPGDPTQDVRIEQNQRVLQLTPEFVAICQSILDRQLDEEEWARVESDDEFQSERFVGGFDATEMAFSFSSYDSVGGESWFQLNLSQIAQVVHGDLTTVSSRRPD